jgi:uncharacterized membrane protein YbhN (UPF0104 family)
MTCGTLPSASSPHPQASRPRGTTAGHGGRVRSAARRGRLVLVWVLAAGAVAGGAIRAPGAASHVQAAFAHLGRLRLSWLSVAITAQVVSLASGAAAQRQLLAAGGVRLPRRTVFALVLASTGLARVMPAGPITAGAWQIREYCRRGAGTPGVRAVLAGGFTSTVVTLALLLPGAAVAGTGSLPLLACAAAALGAGTAGLTVAHRGHALSRWLNRRRHRSPRMARLAAAVTGLERQNTGLHRGAVVLACTVAGLLADAGMLAACFGLTGLPVPWRALLLAYTAGQLSGRLVPLPGGLGGVEGGVVGALALTGTHPAAAVVAAVIVYRVAGYWVPGAAGAATAAVLAWRHPAPSAVPAVTSLRTQTSLEEATPAIAPRELPSSGRSAAGPDQPSRTGAAPGVP